MTYLGHLTDDNCNGNQEYKHISITGDGCHWYLKFYMLKSCLSYKSVGIIIDSMNQNTGIFQSNHKALDKQLLVMFVRLECSLIRIYYLMAVKNNIGCTSRSSLLVFRIFGAWAITIAIKLNSNIAPIVSSDY